MGIGDKVMKTHVDVTPGPLARSLDGLVACSECGELLRGGDVVRNVPVIDHDGDLEYIAIVHDRHARGTS